MKRGDSWSLVEDTRGAVPGPMLPASYGLPYWTETIIEPELCDAAYREVIAAYSTKQLSLVYTPDGSGSQVDLDARYTHYYDPTRLPSGPLIDAAFNAAVNRATRTLWDRDATPAHGTQVLGYEERCMFRTHCDNSLYENGAWSRNDKERDLTGLLYITEWSEHATKPGQFSGGELILDNLVSGGRPVTIRPTKGQLVLFPSHPVFRHQVPSISKGYRIAFVNWWTLR